ncbi:MAG: GreA/GreB family elongation factor [Bacteroidales bacterium]
MNRHHLAFEEAAVNWENKMITISDSNRILEHIKNDIGNINVLPDVLHHLYLLLSNSKKSLSENIPENIVTMNSQIRLLSDNKQQQTIKIVFPEDVSEPGDISVYSPLGVACLGSEEKSFICYYDGKGYTRVKIEKVIFQPEKEKLFYL